MLRRGPRSLRNWWPLNSCYAQPSKLFDLSPAPSSGHMALFVQSVLFVVQPQARIFKCPMLHNSYRPIAKPLKSEFQAFWWATCRLEKYSNTLLVKLAECVTKTWSGLLLWPNPQALKAVNRCTPNAATMQQ